MNKSKKYYFYLKLVSAVIGIAMLISFPLAAVSDEDTEKYSEETEEIVADKIDTEILIGDVNGDKKVNSIDLTRLMKFIAGEIVDISNGDLNEDEKTNGKDLTRLMRIISGEISSVPSIYKQSVLCKNIKADTIEYYSSSFDYDFSVIGRDNKYGIVGWDGEIKLPIEYSEINSRLLGPDSNESQLVGVKDGQEYLIDTECGIKETFIGGWGGGGYYNLFWMDGPIICGNQTGGIEYSEEAYTNYFESNSKAAPVREISQITWDEDNYFYKGQLTTGKYAIMNTETGELLTDFIYDNVNEVFHEGILAVKMNGKWGYMNEKAEMITEFIYSPINYDNRWEWLYSASNGFIVVKRGERFGLIDTEGNIALDPIYESVTGVSSQGKLWFNENGNWNAIQLEKK